MEIEICQIGTTNWPRYVLARFSSDTPQYWNGEVWVSQLPDASLFAFLPDACREFERLQKQHVGQRFVQEFEAKITVKLQGDRTLTEQELARFLNRFAELFLPTDGPTDGSLVQAEIHWHELRERVQDKFLNRPPNEASE